MAKTLPDSLKRTAITRLANLDFELAAPISLPDEVLSRFPALRNWHEREVERHRNNERLIREAVTALREHREDITATTEQTSKVVSWDEVQGKPDCFPPCDTDETTDSGVTDEELAAEAAARAAADAALQAEIDALGTPYYQLVEDEGVPLTQRNTLNFVGPGVTVSDVGGKTEVNIPGGAGNTIYTADDSLTGNREVAQAGNDLEFLNDGAFFEVHDAGYANAQLIIDNSSSIENVFAAVGISDFVYIQSGLIQIGSPDLALSSSGNLRLTAPTSFRLRTPAVVALTAVAGQYLKLINATTGQSEWADVSVTSNEVSQRVQVASAAASSADNHANTVSARAVSISAELASLVQIASAAATSANNHAATASAAATSADAHANTVSVAADVISNAVSALEVRVSALSAVHDVDVFSAVASTTVDISIGTLGHDVVAIWQIGQSCRIIITGTPVAGQTVRCAIKKSAFDSNVYTVDWNTANSFDINGLISSPNTGADFVVDFVYNGAAWFEANRSFPWGNDLLSALSTVSTAISNEISARRSASAALETHINAVSAGVDTVSQAVSALEVRVSALSGAPGGASATSAEVSAGDAAVSAQAASAINVVSAAVDVVSNALSQEISNRQSASAALELHIDAVSARAVSISNELGSLLASASAALETHINAVSARAVSISNELGSLLASASAALETHINTVSARAVSISAELASLIQIASAAATSADGHANTVSARAVSISAELASLVQIASAAATSADGHANAVSARAVSISAELGSLVQIASLAATSADQHAAAASARATSVSNELASLLASAAPRKAVNTGDQASITVSGGAGTTVSGVSLALSAGVLYAFEFQIPFRCTAGAGIHVAVVGPATNQYAAKYEIPGASAYGAAVVPAANAVQPYLCQVRAIGTKVSTVSITLTGTTLMAFAKGVINPSAAGSLKFTIGPNTSGGANTGVIPLNGCNLRVWRMNG